MAEDSKPTVGAVDRLLEPWNEDEHQRQRTEDGRRRDQPLDATRADEHAREEKPDAREAEHQLLAHGAGELRGGQRGGRVRELDEHPERQEGERREEQSVPRSRGMDPLPVGDQ